MKFIGIVAHTSIENQVAVLEEFMPKTYVPECNCMSIKVESYLHDYNGF